MAVHQVSPDLPAPIVHRGVVGWLRENLFSTWYNSIITLVLGYLLLSWLIPLINWAFIDAVFMGTGPESCAANAACWVFIEQRLGFLFTASTLTSCDGAQTRCLRFLRSRSSPSFCRCQAVCANGSPYLESVACQSRHFS